MSFDVYAGPLCRYYARAFQSPTQKLFPNAKTVQLGPDGNALIVADQPSPLELLPSIRGWQRLITPRLTSAGVPPPEWDERIDAPTLTEQLTHSGYWSIRLLAAYTEFPELNEPLEPPTTESLAADAALACLRGNEIRSRYSHLHACEVWLPSRIAEPIDLELPTGRTQPVGSVGLLRAELAALLRNLGTEPPNALDLGDAQKPPAGASASPLRCAAWHTLMQWMPLVDEARQSRLPVLLDY